MAAKGYDDSPPRNGVIFFYSILTIVFLFGAQQLLNSYFGTMMAAEFHEKVDTVGLQGAVDAKARDQAELAKFDIEAAKRLYVQRGRGASPVIASESGANKAAIGGWTQLPRNVAVVPPAAPAAPAAPDAMPAPAAAPASEVPSEGTSGAASGPIRAPARSGHASPSAGAGVTTNNTSTGRVPAPAPGAAAAAPAAAPSVGSAGDAKGKP